MNLNVSPPKILAMCSRGYAAAVALEKFDFTTHRDVRYRTAMAELDRASRDMLGKYDATLPGGLPGYRDFVLHSPFPRADGPWKQAAVARTDRLLTFVGRVPGEPGRHDPIPAPDFMDPGTEPHPIPDLRIVAHF